MDDVIVCLAAIGIYFALVAVTGAITWLQMRHEHARKIDAACTEFNGRQEPATDSATGPTLASRKAGLAA